MATKSIDFINFKKATKIIKNKEHLISLDFKQIQRIDFTISLRKL